MSEFKISKEIIITLFDEFKKGIELDEIIKKYSLEINYNEYILVSYYEYFDDNNIIDLKCLIEKDIFFKLKKRSGKIIVPSVNNDNLNIDTEDFNYHSNKITIENFYLKYNLGNQSFLNSITNFVSNTNEDDEFSNSDNDNLSEYDDLENKLSDEESDNSDKLVNNEESLENSNAQFNN